MSSKSKKTGHGAPWWAAVGVGALLVVIPEPATTATGLAILAAALGASALSSN